MDFIRAELGDSRTAFAWVLAICGANGDRTRKNASAHNLAKEACFPISAQPLTTYKTEATNLAILSKNNLRQGDKPLKIIIS